MKLAFCNRLVAWRERAGLSQAFTDPDELNDDRTHNVVNELTARDTDDNGTDNYALVYDNAGNLTDDAQNYEYMYDAFGRLRMRSRQTILETRPMALRQSSRRSSRACSARLGDLLASLAGETRRRILAELAVGERDVTSLL